MRIAAVTNMYPAADDKTRGTFIEQQVKGLEDQGVEVEVVCLDRRRGLSVYLGVNKAIKKLVKSFDPHLIHVMYGGALAELATRGTRLRPTVLSFCGSDLLGDVGRSLLLRNTLGRYGVIASHAAARRADGIVVKSAVLRAALPPLPNGPPVWVVPNGIDLQRFKPMNRGVCESHLGWPSGHFHVLFPGGTHNPRKRLPLAEAAVGILKASGVPVELQILEGVSHEEVPIWLNASDALIMCSIHEGSPNIVKEALACNVPVVSVDVGDVKERIQSIDGCFLTEATPEHLADGLKSVFLGRRRVDGRRQMQELSIQSVAERLIDIYRSVLTKCEAKHDSARLSQAATYTGRLND
jgi:teichuronic acid biosynthesis glycosyltransferase TuaC